MRKQSNKKLSDNDTWYPDPSDIPENTINNTIVYGKPITWKIFKVIGIVILVAIILYLPKIFDIYLVRDFMESVDRYTGRMPRQ